MLSQGQSGEMMLMSRCTCSAGRHCKHVAAMLLKVVAERAPKEGSPTAPSSMLSWADDLRRTSIAVAKKKPGRPVPGSNCSTSSSGRPTGASSALKSARANSPESAEEWWKVDRAIATPPQFVTEDDLGILRLIWAERGHETGLRAFGIGPKNGAEILQRMVASHRLYPEDDLGLPLQAGALRPASIGWQLDNQGFQRPYLKPEPSAEMIIAVDPPWYLDLAEGEIGPLKVAGNPSVINRLFSLPPLSAKEAAQVAEH